MKKSETVLVIPPNDAEAVLIKQIAEKIHLPIIESHQLHGASLDKGHDYVREILNGGYKKAIIVEMPGVKAEKRLRKSGIELEIIDHHHYTGLDRAHSASGELLGSSLEQFLKLLRISDTQLHNLGFVSRLVHGVGIQDRGYIWSLQDEGYTKKEIEQVLAYTDALTAHLHNPQNEARKHRLAEAAWKRRKRWHEFFIVSTRADLQLRPRISRIIVETIGKPTPLIIVEKKRGLIYVQESPFALHLFERFGGFTFGLDRNWGIRNIPGKPSVTLRDVKKAILQVRHKTSKEA